MILMLRYVTPILFLDIKYALYFIGGRNVRLNIGFYCFDCLLLPEL